jgi:nucleotide-binding universal stress UspA family protein
MIARRTKARLHILHVAPTFGDDPLRNAYAVSLNEERFYQALRNEMDQRMKAMITEAQGEREGILRIHSRGAAPGPVIVEYAFNQRIDLIVMGTHGRRGVRRMLLGSVSTEVIRSAPCEVLTVHEDRPVVEPNNDAATLLVPVDLSPTTTPLLKRAKALGRILGATLDVVHVVESLSLPAWGVDTHSLNEWLPSRMAGVRATLKQLADDALGDEIAYNLFVEEGNPARAILARAESPSIKLVILAPRGSGWLDHLPLGSVTDRVITTTDCPVFLIQTPDPDDASQEASLKEAQAEG